MSMLVFPPRLLLFYGYYFNLNYLLSKHTCNIYLCGFHCYQNANKIDFTIPFLSSDWNSNSSTD